jgi:hypothetical protein
MLVLSTNVFSHQECPSIVLGRVKRKAASHNEVFTSTWEQILVPGSATRASRKRTLSSITPE